MRFGTGCTYAQFLIQATMRYVYLQGLDETLAVVHDKGVGHPA